MKKEKSSYFAASVSIKAANQQSGVTCSVIPVINRRNIPLIVLFPLRTNLQRINKIRTLLKK